MSAHDDPRDGARERSAALSGADLIPPSTHILSVDFSSPASSLKRAADHWDKQRRWNGEDRSPDLDISQAGFLADRRKPGSDPSVPEACREDSHHLGSERGVASGHHCIGAVALGESDPAARTGHSYEFSDRLSGVVDVDQHPVLVTTVNASVFEFEVAGVTRSKCDRQPGSPGASLRFGEHRFAPVKADSDA